MSTIDIPIPSDLTDYLQMLAYEIESLKVLHTHALDSNISEDKTNKIKQEFIDKISSYNITKDEINELYVKPVNGKSWTLDFNESTLHITVDDKE